MLARSFVWVWISVLLVTPVLADDKTKTHAGHGAATGQHEHGAHQHGEHVMVPSGPAAPSLDFVIAKDSVGGWNLHIRTTNFRFAPENVNGSHKDGEGHAHLYVNGAKIARVYGPWFHIGALTNGRNEVTVTLNANDHRVLAIGDAPLSVTKEVLVH